MYDVLRGIEGLVQDYFDKKVENVRYSSDEAKDSVRAVIDETVDKVYDICSEMISSAEYEIDNTIEDMSSDYERELGERQREFENDFFAYNRR